MCIGDSRTSLGYRNTAGGITAVNLTVDHKPDLPAEKVRYISKFKDLYPYICTIII
jgi:serine/threonine protein phosphatase PrpC